MLLFEGLTTYRLAGKLISAEINSRSFIRAREGGGGISLGSEATL